MPENFSLRFSSPYSLIRKMQNCEMVCYSYSLFVFGVKTVYRDVHVTTINSLHIRSVKNRIPKCCSYENSRVHFLGTYCVFCFRHNDSRNKPLNILRLCDHRRRNRGLADDQLHKVS